MTNWIFLSSWLWLRFKVLLVLLLKVMPSLSYFEYKFCIKYALLRLFLSDWLVSPSSSWYFLQIRILFYFIFLISRTFWKSLYFVSSCFLLFYPKISFSNSHSSGHSPFYLLSLCTLIYESTVVNVCLVLYFDLWFPITIQIHCNVPLSPLHFPFNGSFD